MKTYTIIDNDGEILSQGYDEENTRQNLIVFYWYDCEYAEEQERLQTATLEEICKEAELTATAME